MKQIMQDLRRGKTSLVDVPRPLCGPDQVLIASRYSLISGGTERTLIEFGQANLLAKARSRPDKVQQVLNKLTTDGLLPTLEAVFPVWKNHCLWVTVTPVRSLKLGKTYLISQ